VKSVRPIALCIAATAACSGLSACGGRTAAPAGSAASTADRPITKAQAAAYAQAVNLRAADLPHMTVTAPEQAGKAPGRQDRELATCDGGPDPGRVIAKIHSASFGGAVEGEDEGIKSNVEVEPTDALAAQSGAVALSPRFVRCIKRFLPRVFGEANGRGRARYGRATVSRLPTPLPDVKESFGVRIATTVTSTARVGQPPIPVYIDEFGFVSGRVEVSLTAFGAPQPVPTETAERLLALLRSRAEAHTL
jgi:hypothetical protein